MKGFMICNDCGYIIHFEYQYHHGNKYWCDECQTGTMTVNTLPGIIIIVEEEHQ